jgi:hypothetical protein
MEEDLERIWMQAAAVSSRWYPGIFLEELARP